MKLVDGGSVINGAYPGSSFFTCICYHSLNLIKILNQGQVCMSLLFSFNGRNQPYLDINVSFDTSNLWVQINANYVEYSPAVLLPLTAIYYWGLGETPDSKYRTQKPLTILPNLIPLVKMVSK